MAWNRNMAASYKQEMKKLSGRTADLAFIGRSEAGAVVYLGAAGFMETSGHKMDFPDAFLGRLYDYTKCNHPSSEGWRDRL